VAEAELFKFECHRRAADTNIWVRGKHGVEVLKAGTVRSFSRLLEAIMKIDIESILRRRDASRRILSVRGPGESPVIAHYASPRSS
jgi:hypothetical protein